MSPPTNLSVVVPSQSSFRAVRRFLVNPLGLLEHADEMRFSVKTQGWAVRTNVCRIFEATPECQAIMSNQRLCNTAVPNKNQPLAQLLRFTVTTLRLSRPFRSLTSSRRFFDASDEQLRITEMWELRSAYAVGFSASKGQTHPWQARNQRAPHGQTRYHPIHPMWRDQRGIEHNINGQIRIHPLQSHRLRVHRLTNRRRVVGRLRFKKYMRSTPTLSSVCCDDWECIPMTQPIKRRTCFARFTGIGTSSILRSRSSLGCTHFVKNMPTVIDAAPTFAVS